MKCPVLLSDFNTSGISPQFLVRITRVKFENNLQGLGADSISQTDRHASEVSLSLYPDMKTSGRIGSRSDRVGFGAGMDYLERRKKLLPLPGIEHRFSGRPTRSIVAVLTELPRPTSVKNAPS